MEINEHFEYFGAYLNRSCHNETATITLHCLSKHLKEFLPVIREITYGFGFPGTGTGNISSKTAYRRLLVNLQKCDFVANRIIDQYLYGAHHPYGRVSSVEDITGCYKRRPSGFF